MVLVAEIEKLPLEFAKYKNVTIRLNGSNGMCNGHSIGLIRMTAQAASET